MPGGLGNLGGTGRSAMPSASVKPHVSDDRRRTRLRVDPRIAVAALVALIAIALLAPSIQPGPFVRRVTIVNHSEYAVDVDVSGAQPSGWMALATAADHA